jgi:hypothetical protein
VADKTFSVLSWIAMLFFLIWAAADKICTFYVQNFANFAKLSGFKIQDSRRNFLNPASL